MKDKSQRRPDPSMEFSICMWIDEIPIPIVETTSDNRHALKVVVPQVYEDPEVQARDIVVALRTIANLIDYDPRILKSDEYYDDAMTSGVDFHPD